MPGDQHDDEHGQVAREHDAHERGDGIRSDDGSEGEDDTRARRVLPHVVADREAPGDQQVGPLGIELDVVDDARAIGIGHDAGDEADEQGSGENPGDDDGR